MDHLDSWGLAPNPSFCKGPRCPRPLGEAVGYRDVFLTGKKVKERVLLTLRKKIRVDENSEFVFQSWRAVLVKTSRGNPGEWHCCRANTENMVGGKRGFSRHMNGVAACQAAFPEKRDA